MSENEDLKKPLKDIQNQLNWIRKELSDARISINDATMKMLDGQISNNKNSIAQWKTSVIESRLSDFNLYWSIYLSALVGVMGNWFVTLWFQPPTESTLQGLITSGIILVLTFAFLLIQMIKSGRRIKAPTNIP